VADIDHETKARESKNKEAAEEFNKKLKELIKVSNLT